MLEAGRWSAFLVGNCAEWEDDEPPRAPTGDRGLYHTLCRLKNRDDLIDYVIDDDCTANICQERLESLLRKDDSSIDTLLFYYGGHGLVAGFETAERIWHYKEVVNTIESLFTGSSVWFLLDCCYSGSLAWHIPKSSRFSYLVMASQKAEWEASDDWWSMTECMVNALNYHMECCCPWNEGLEYPDSYTIEDLVIYMAEHHSVCKRDWFQALLLGNDTNSIRPDTPIVKEKQKSSCSSTISKQKEPPKAPVDTHRWKRFVGLRKGDEIFARWKGTVPGISHTLLPMFYQAFLLEDLSLESIANNETKINICLRHHDIKWHSHVAANQLLPGSSFHCHEEAAMIESHCLLSEQGRYLDHSIKGDTRVWVLWGEENGEREICRARVLGLELMDEAPWKDLIETSPMVGKRFESFKGSFLWVEWLAEKGEWDLVPKCFCSFDSITPSLPALKIQVKRCANFQNMNPAAAMEESLKSRGQTVLRNSMPLEADGPGVVCLWDGAERAGAVLHEQVTLKVLSEIFRFDIKGEFYCVRWDDDRSISPVPSALLRM